MQHHPSYPVLSSLLIKYPNSAGPFFQTYNDILFTQGWKDLIVLDLSSCSRGAIKAFRPQTETLYVVPCSLTESLSISWLQDAFKDLGNPKEIYLGITADDASIVYYKISQGIVKPPM